MAAWYVNALSGSDANPGTNPSPVQTIARASTLSAAGDTVVVEGDGCIYTETIDGTGSGAAKANVTYEGVGSSSQPIIDGQFVRDYGAKTSRAGQVLRGLEIRNVNQSGIYLAAGSGNQNTLLNQVVEACHIHHVRKDGWGGDAYGVEARYSNPAIRGCRIHHVGQGGEGKGILFNTCRDHVADGNDIFAVRKEAIRDSVGLRGQVINNKAWLNWSAFHIATCVSPLVANNFSYLNAVGLSVKHCNDPTKALAPWGYTLANVTSGAVARARAWHNTVYGAVSQHILFAIDDDPVSAGGYSYYVEFTNNLILGNGTELIWQNPNSRPDTTCVLDYNVYESRLDRRPARFCRQGAATSNPVYAEFATMAAMISGGLRTQNWEGNGRELPVDLVDPAGGDLNPITAPDPRIELPSQWGAQVGARQAAVSTYAWTPESPIVISTKTTTSATQKGYLTDGKDDHTVQTSSNLDETIILDLGSVRTFNHLRWTVFGHAKPYGVHLWSLETGASSSGAWTVVVDHAVFPDSFASEFLWELPQPVTAQWVRFTAHENFYVTTLVGSHTLPVATLNVASTRLDVPNSSGVHPPLASSGSVRVGAAGTVTVDYVGKTETTLTNCTGGTGTFADGSRVSWDVFVFAEIAVGTLAVTSAEPPPPPIAPVADATNPPVIIGTPEAGTQITCTSGAWQNNPTSFAYEWRIGGVAVSGSRGIQQTFTPLDSEVGGSLTCRVTATNTAGSATADSAAVTITAAPPTLDPPVCTAVPAISGTPQTGQTLQGTLGTWDGSPTSYTQKWQRQTTGTWADIASATSLTYILQAADEGHQVRLAVAATNAAGTTSAFSVPIDAIAVPVTPPPPTAGVGVWL